jgi:cysteinyl-tRNA synthetase
MDDDFNSPKALGQLFDFVAASNTLVADKTFSEGDAKLLEQVKGLIVEFMGVFGVELDAVEGACSGYPTEVVDLAAELAAYGGSSPDEAVQALLDARADARANKDWGLADAVRDRMAELGFTIMDTPQGARVEYDG